MGKQAKNVVKTGKVGEVFFSLQEVARKAPREGEAKNFYKVKIYTEFKSDEFGLIQSSAISQWLEEDAVKALKEGFAEARRLSSGSTTNAIKEAIESAGEGCGIA